MAVRTTSTTWPVYLWLAALARHVCAQTWHLVDVPSIVCPGGPGTATVKISTDGMDFAKEPHIFTFYRSSNKMVNIRYAAMDREQKVILPESSVQLQALGRRLAAAGPPGEDDLMAEAPGAAPGVPERRMVARNRGGRSGGRLGGGGFGSRRNGRNNERERTSKFSNPNPAAGAGNYQYPSQTILVQNFPAGHTATPYGYSGAEAYQPSWGTTIAMAAVQGAVSGLAHGMVYSYYSRWHTYGQESGGSSSSSSSGSSNDGGEMRCTYGSFSGTCKACNEQFGPNKCVTAIMPSEAMARDDLMSTGFAPAKFSSPIEITISSVVGADFHKRRICPPQGWHPNASLSAVSWEAPPNQDLFITLTKMEAVPEDDEAAVPKEAVPAGEHAAPAAALVLIVSALGCCVLLRKRDMRAFSARGIEMFSPSPPLDAGALEEPAPAAPAAGPAPATRHAGAPAAA